MSGAKYNATVIVTSDTCYEDPTSDESGSYVVEQLKGTKLFSKVRKHIMKDEEVEIVNCLETSIAEDDPALVITIGGTGLCPRDVTPEATSSLYDRHCTGITSGLHIIGMRDTNHAALSRLTSGIIGGTLVVNFPGKLRACQTYIVWLNGILEHALEQVRFDFKSYTRTHTKQKQQVQRKARPMNNRRGSGASMTASETSNGTISSRLSKSLSKIKLNAIPRGPALHNGPQRGHQAKRAPSVGARSVGAGKPSIIEELMDSRRDFPTVVTAQSETGSIKSGRANSSVRSLKTPIRRTEVQPIPTNSLVPKENIKPIQPNFQLMPFMQALEKLSEVSINLLGKKEEVTLNNFLQTMSYLGRVLAQDVKPKRLVPPYSVSTMDGYVLHVPPALKGATRDTRSIKAPLLASLEEFERRQNIDKDTYYCYQVNTGGKLPKFNYAVVPVEQTTVTSEMVVFRQVNQGAHVRRAGVDISETDRLLRGTIIGPVEMGAIMAMGHKSIQVYRRPKLAVLSTGDELEDFFASETIEEEAVVDLNGPMLISMFRQEHFHTQNLGVARDDPNEICAKLRSALSKYDVVIITGGASMGTKDHVKSVIVHLGGTIHFGRVNMKPGKPAAFASVMIGDSRKFIFSLPGNPVSAFVTAKLLVLPFLKHGLEQCKEPKPKIALNSVGDFIYVEIQELEDGDHYDFEDRLEFMRAKIVQQKHCHEGRPLYLVNVSVKQQSSRMLSLLDCDCLIMIDPNTKERSLKRGSKLPALKLHR